MSGSGRPSPGPAPARFPTGRYISPANGHSGEHGKAHTYALGCRCPYCRNANTEARFWARRAKSAQAAAPWLDPGSLADRGDSVGPVKYYWFSRYVFGTAVRRAEIGWTPTFHDLRHGMLSWSYDAGASPAVVQRDAGHASVQTTQGYMHVVDKVVGTERLAAMKIMYDRVDAASALPLVAEPAALSPTALEQLSAGVMSSDTLRRTAADSFEDFGAYLVSVEAVVDGKVRLSTAGRLRSAGLVLLATFNRPHFDVVLTDLSQHTLKRLVDCFDDPIDNPGRGRRGVSS